MRRTDYGPIAGRYDRARDRHRIPTDALLAGHLEKVSGAFRLLDLACGTGNYLVAQRRMFADERIVWHGVDASDAMLAEARRKLDGIPLLRARAEALPHGSGSIHFLACNFAFHHFEDKERALDEMARVLTPSAAISITNVAPEHMRDWWVYQVFPAAWTEDQKRFWPIEGLLEALEARGFAARSRVELTRERVAAADLYEQAVHRDLSSVAILDDGDFAAGLARLRHGAARGEILETKAAVVRCTAAR